MLSTCADPHVTVTASVAHVACSIGTEGVEMTTSMATKLGLHPEHVICVLDMPALVVEAMHAALPAGIRVKAALTQPDFDAIFFYPTTPMGIAQYLNELAHLIEPGGAIWVVMPQKAVAVRRGITFTWEQMQAEALQTDLVDNKIVSITDEDYATRFVIRKDRRHLYARAASRP